MLTYLPTYLPIDLSKGGVYSLSISKTDFEPYLAEKKDQVYVFGIQCGPMPVSFSVLLRFVQAQIWSASEGTDKIRVLSGQVSK